MELLSNEALIDLINDGDLFRPDVRSVYEHYARMLRREHPTLAKVSSQISELLNYLDEKDCSWIEGTDVIPDTTITSEQKTTILKRVREEIQADGVYSYWPPESN